MSADEVVPVEVTDPINQTIRAEYLAGLIDLTTALDRLEANGMYRHRPWSTALLSRPMSPERVRHFAGADVTEEQIAARLAEVKG